LPISGHGEARLARLLKGEPEMLAACTTRQCREPLDNTINCAMGGMLCHHGRAVGSGLGRRDATSKCPMTNDQCPEKLQIPNSQASEILQKPSSISPLSAAFRRLPPLGETARTARRRDFQPPFPAFYRLLPPFCGRRGKESIRVSECRRIGVENADWCLKMRVNPHMCGFGEKSSRNMAPTYRNAAKSGRKSNKLFANKVLCEKNASRPCLYLL
jgi:hypothetical protein